MKTLLVGLLSFMSLSVYAESTELFSDIEPYSIECQLEDQYCKGDKVLDADTIRTVELVDNTGRIVLEDNRTYNSYGSTVSGFVRKFTTPSHVTKVVPSHGGFKAGDILLDEDTIRTIELVDNTGRIVLKDNRSYNFYGSTVSGYVRKFTKSSHLSKVVPSHDGFKAGDTVLAGDTIRTIEFVDNTGRIVLKDNRSYNSYGITVSGYGRKFVRNSNISMIQECEKRLE